jgi:hypothetical protein
MDTGQGMVADLGTVSAALGPMLTGGRRGKQANMGENRNTHFKGGAEKAAGGIAGAVKSVAPKAAEAAV